MTFKILSFASSERIPSTPYRLYCQLRFVHPRCTIECHPPFPIGLGLLTQTSPTSTPSRSSFHKSWIVRPGYHLVNSHLHIPQPRYPQNFTFKQHAVAILDRQRHPPITHPEPSTLFSHRGLVPMQTSSRPIALPGPAIPGMLSIRRRTLGSYASSPRDPGSKNA